MVLADTSKGDIGWKKWFVTGWAFVECFLFGGLMFGWGSVVFMLKNEGVYADLCPRDESFNATNETTKLDNDDEVVCEAQDSRMTLCFTIASALFSIGAAVLGHINYIFGTRITRLLSLWVYFSYYTWMPSALSNFKLFVHVLIIAKYMYIYISIRKRKISFVILALSHYSYILVGILIVICILFVLKTKKSLCFNNLKPIYRVDFLRCILYTFVLSKKWNFTLF